ncbi:MAG: C-GCAxxG-C-C family protein [Bacteroidales bacterium]|nr:C-GCAxxG-C-C family protein [Bacteroidales bacterium]
MTPTRLSAIDDWAAETENRVSQGIAYFKKGLNCAQSVALAFSDFYDIPDELMLRIAASFGGGIGRMRETCGAACGMFLLAGLEVTNPTDTATTDGDTPEQPIYPNAEVKKKNYEVVQQLAATFKQLTGSLLCKELLGLSSPGASQPIPTPPTPEERTAAYYQKRPCAWMVETAIRTYMHYLQGKYFPQATAATDNMQLP